MTGRVSYLLTEDSLTVVFMMAGIGRTCRLFIPANYASTSECADEVVNWLAARGATTIEHEEPLRLTGLFADELTAEGVARELVTLREELNAAGLAVHGLD